MFCCPVTVPCGTQEHMTHQAPGHAYACMQDQLHGCPSSRAHQGTQHHHTPRKHMHAELAEWVSKQQRTAGNTAPSHATKHMHAKSTAWGVTE
jgi:hypothetical protein